MCSVAGVAVRVFSIQQPSTIMCLKLGQERQEKNIKIKYTD